MDEELQLKNRLVELYERAESKGCYVYSDFLTLAGQNILCKNIPVNAYILFGGYENSERAIACFGNVENCGYEEIPPVSCIEVKPLSQKFADKLTHRDFLGALMALGIRREVLGDIIIHENTGYIFCLDSIAQYIIDNFNQVKHTSVSSKRIDSPPIESIKLPDEIELVVASKRCDVLIAAVYNISRNESQKLFEQKLVFIDSIECRNASRELDEGNLVSVRGKGRFIFCGEKRTTKKGKLRISVRIF